MFSINFFNLSLSLEKETEQCNDELRLGYNNSGMTFWLMPEFIVFMFIPEKLKSSLANNIEYHDRHFFKTKASQLLQNLW